MTAADRFRYYYKPAQLKELYNSKIIHRATVGMDRIVPTKFEDSLDENVELISRKVLSGQYQFTHYREILISKGRNKCPRVISIPTIRDKLSLAAFHAVLQDTYRGVVEEPLLHTVINEISREVFSGMFDSYVKVDIQRFYSSIDHKILLAKVRRKIHKKEALNFLEQAISTATVPEGTKLADKCSNEIGVPEGLSISNILADIYLSDLKQLLKARYSIAYYRYVDDILILCNSKDAKAIQDEIIKILKERYALKVHPDKTVHGQLNVGVPYLGYIFFDNRIGVKQSAILKIENNIEMLFRLRSRNAISQEVFVWRLNLKIAGCIYEQKKYGWLFYYSQLTDLTELYHLDWFVNKLFTRFKIEKPIELMRFVRVYHEITKNVSRSTYLINADKYSMEQKVEIVHSVYGRKRINPESEEYIDRLFHQVMFKEIQKLEHDIQNFS